MRRFHLGNNLPMNIREITDFSQELPSVKTKFKGCSESNNFSTVL